MQARSKVVQEWRDVERHNLAVEIIEELGKALDG
jgi:hypothetical protein